MLVTSIFLFFPQCFQKPHFGYKNFPNNKNFNQTNLTAFTDEFKVPKMMISIFDKSENVGKEENACYQHFLVFPTMFSKTSLCLVIKTCNFVV